MILIRNLPHNGRVYQRLATKITCLLRGVKNDIIFGIRFLRLLTGHENLGDNSRNIGGDDDDMRRASFVADLAAYIF
jgi:hypothetical protein